MVVICLGSCRQVKASAPYPRVSLFLNHLKASIQSRPQEGIIRGGGAGWYPLTASEIRGIMRYLSRRGVTVSDVNLDHGMPRTYSLRQVQTQIQKREGEVFDQLCEVDELCSYQDPNVSQVRYKVIRGGLIVFTVDDLERLTFKYEQGHLQLRNMDNLRVYGGGP